METEGFTEGVERVMRAFVSEEERVGGRAFVLVTQRITRVLWMSSEGEEREKEGGNGSKDQGFSRKSEYRTRRKEKGAHREGRDGENTGS